MKKVLLLILFSIAILGIRAQGYVPKVGETIMFYPLTEKAKQEYHGYDCFYDVTKVISNGKYKFKKGYQYKCDKNGLTSFDEIEGKTFKVLKAENFLHNEKKENKVFLLFLSCIEDGSEIVLRVPFFEKNASFLTRSLISEKIEGYLQNTKYTYVNLPCIPVEYMTELKKKYQNKDLIYKESSIKNEFGKIDFESVDIRERIFNGIITFINRNIIKSILHKENIGKCIDIRFEESEISHYAHPYAICTCENNLKNDTIKIPIAYISGNSSYFNETTSYNYLFENFYIIRDEVILDLFLKENNLNIINKFTGKDVYYGVNGVFDYSANDNQLSKYIVDDIKRIGDNLSYVLKEGIYKCVKFDVSQDRSKGYAILEDSLGVKFRVPATKLFPSLEEGYHLYNLFQDCFMLVDEASALKEEKRLLTIQKEKEEKERYASWVKKYGTTYAKYINELSELKREKFERLVSKYGKETAKMMVEGKVRIGWNKQMCRESWGEPDDINKTIGSWGTHEQWVYGEIYCSYLYFENGILTTIQN